MNKIQLADAMNVVAADVQKTIRAARSSGLSADAAALAALIGVFSVIRVDGLKEDSLLSEARLAVPRRVPGDGVVQLVES